MNSRSSIDKRFFSHMTNCTNCITIPTHYSAATSLAKTCTAEGLANKNSTFALSFAIDQSSAPIESVCTLRFINRPFIHFKRQFFFNGGTCNGSSQKQEATNLRFSWLEFLNEYICTENSRDEVDCKANFFKRCCCLCSYCRNFRWN